MGEYATAVRAECATELERLSSDRGLIALTDADLSGPTIKTRIAATDLALADRFEAWANAEDGPVATAFQDAADLKHEHATRISESLDSTVGPAEAGLAAHLDGVETTAARLGAGLVGVPLVLDGRYLQVVSFYVNEADETAADQFRAVRSETGDLLDRGERLLADHDDDTAEAAAVSLVEAAYADYVDTLEAMGLDPKTVC